MDPLTINCHINVTEWKIFTINDAGTESKSGQFLLAGRGHFHWYVDLFKELLSLQFYKF